MDGDESAPMTHAPPDDANLALLLTWIDHTVTTESLRFSARISQLLDTQMIARSVTEHKFLSRKPAIKG